MEYKLVGSVKVASLTQGSNPWKGGTVRLYCNDKWRIGVSYTYQKKDQYTWMLRKRVKKVICKGHSPLLLEFTRGGEMIRMKDVTDGDPLRFKELIELMNEGKYPLEDNRQLSENRPQAPMAKPVQKSTQDPPRVPLSPKQPHTSKDIGKSSDAINSSARKNIQYLERGQAKSVEKLSNTFASSASFYGKRSENQRVYGALGVGSIKRLKRPGLMPDPERNAKRPRSEIKYDWMKKPATPTKTELTGFSNLGNTCYMNAILQSLYHLPTFGDDLMTLFKKFRKRQGCFPTGSLFVALGSLLITQKSDGPQERKRRCLGAIKSAISASAKRFSGYEQHDAHEFLAQVLDQLKEETIELNKKVEKEKDLLDEIEGEEPVTPEGRNVSGEGTPQGTAYENPTIKNFEFTVLHTILCLGCGERVEKEETFHDLSLDVPRRSMCYGERTLQDALDLFFKDEEIEYKCEECGNGRSHVHHQFTRLPRILIMHLKRYSIQQEGLIFGKSGGSTAIPRYINLQAHCTEMTSPPFPPDLNNSISNDSLEINKLLTDSPPIAADTPSRRKLDFQGSFKHVQAHIRVDASGGRLSEGHTAESTPKRGIISPFQHRDHKNTSEDKARSLEEDGIDLTMLTDEDDLAVFPLQNQYHQRPVLAQVDGTIDLIDSSSQESLDEEELKKLSEEAQLELAMRRSRRLSTVSTPNNEACGNQTAPSLISDDSLETITSKDFSSSKLNPQLTITDTRCDTQSKLGENVSKSEEDVGRTGNAGTFPEGYKQAAKQCDESSSEQTEDSGDNGEISENRDFQRTSMTKNRMFPLFYNKLSPRKMKFSDEKHDKMKTKTIHPQETEECVAEREVVKEKIDESVQHVFNQSETQDLISEFEKDMVDDAAELPDISPQKDEKRRQLVIKDGDDGSFNQHADGPQKKDEDKENVTPPIVEIGADCDMKEPDWIEKRKEDVEKEERELQHALQMSLQEQEDTEQREKEEIRRATELSLQELNGDVWMTLESDDEPCGEEQLSQRSAFTKEQIEQLRINSRTGELPYSYRLVSVVSHLGSSSTVGHYVSDALDIRKNQWRSYDDSHVTKTTEMNVCTSRQQTGYVFFYCAKELIEELEEFYQHGLDVRTT